MVNIQPFACWLNRFVHSKRVQNSLRGNLNLVSPLVEQWCDRVAAAVEYEDDGVLRLPARHGLHRDGRLQQLVLHGAHEALGLHRLLRVAEAGPAMRHNQHPTW